MIPSGLLAVASVSSTILLLAKITLILGVAWISQMMLRSSNPRWRILMWRVVAIGLMGVFVLGLRAPVFTFPLLPAVSTVPGATDRGETTIRQPPLTEHEMTPRQAAAMNQASSLHQRPSDSLHAAREPTSVWTQPPTTTDEFVEANEAEAYVPFFFASLSKIWSWLFLVWLVGVVVGTLSLLTGLVRVAHICRDSAPVPAWVESEIDQIAGRASHARRVNVRQTENVTAPCSAGLVQETILLPSTMCDEDRTIDVRAVLAHEAAHLTGHDLGWNLLLHVVSVLLWPHPLAWRIRLAHADACDERCDGVAASYLQDAAGYGRLLARVALEISGRALTTALPMARSSSVSSRIQMISRGSGLHGIPRWKTRTIATLLAAPVVFFGTVGVSPSSSTATADAQSVAGNRVTEETDPKDKSSPASNGEPAEETNSRDSSDEIELVPLDSDVPRLVAVWPGNGADNVDPNTELHLRFDRPIDPLSFQLEWRRGSYLECGTARYLEDKHQLVFPVRLEPEREHTIVINSMDASVHFTHGFVSSDGLHVASSEWQFRTKGRDQVADGQPPRVVSIHPPPESEVARVVWVRIRFDQAMDPLAFSFSNNWPGLKDVAQVNSAVTYDEDKQEFLFPIVLPGKWTGTIELSGLRSRNGVEANPITLSYSTGSDRLDPEEQRRLLRPDSLAKLQELINNVRRGRDELQSVSETVHTVSFSAGRLRQRGFAVLDGNWTRFKMQGERQFYGDVSQVMRITPFKIGCDGAQCWFYSRRPNENGEMMPTLVSCDYDDIQEKLLTILDPFNFEGRELKEVVKHTHLEYLGPSRIQETDCHVVQSLKVHDYGIEDAILLMVQRWWIDAETFRPLQLTADYSGSRTVNYFRYDSINEELPITQFQPTIAKGTIRRGLEPLGDGYDTRFLKVSDGSNGRMSSRWGKTGSKGRSSSGLN